MSNEEEKQTQTEDTFIEGAAPEGEEAVDAPENDGAGGEAVDLEQKVKDLEARLNDGRDQVLRAQAEMQNVRRRAEKDVENARRYALEKFSVDLLPVVDNLERTLENAPDDEAVKVIVEGVELTLKSFSDALGRFQIVAVDPAGEPFDPQLHQAMTMVPNPDIEPNTVMHVVQKGYTLNGRLIRPAMVVVSQAVS
ncbi:MAG: nucleotide exchange factor GrpE [Pseudomonadales bacterium]